MSDQQTLPKEIILRILNLSKQNYHLTLKDESGETLFEFTIGDLLHLDDKGSLNIYLGEDGLKIKGNLVGMGGFYYHPELFWGGNVENVIDSWNWLLNLLKLDVSTFQCVIESNAILDMLFTGHEKGLIFLFLSLFVDLYELHLMHVDIHLKINELRKQVKGHIRNYEKLKDENIPEALHRITHLRRYLADISSECRLARLAKAYGLEVKLGNHPDLIVNDKKIEVKRVGNKYLDSKRAHVMFNVNLENPIKNGLAQNPDIIAIHVNTLAKQTINGFKTTWLARDHLETVLEKALTFNRKTKLIILFNGTSGGYFGRIIILK